MPEHIAIGKNYQTGVVNLLAQKSINITFPTPFDSIPAVDLTLGENSISIPYRINTNLIGFTLKFNINYTGDVEWKAIKK